MEPDDDTIPGVSGLAREFPPRAALEERTVGALANQGLLQRSTVRRPRWWQMAAAAALFVAGVAIGRASSPEVRPATGDGSPRFLFLLHGGPTGQTDEQEAAVVTEYGAWAGSLRREGRAVSGERLGDRRAIVPDVDLPDVDGLRGYFLISARDFDEALAVARECPHARRGGQIVVRPIE